MTLKEVAAAAKQLSLDEREILILELMEELSAEEQAKIDRAWSEEIRRRVADLDAGRVSTRPVDEVIAELQSGRYADR